MYGRSSDFTNCLTQCKSIIFEQVDGSGLHDPNLISSLLYFPLVLFRRSCVPVECGGVAANDRWCQFKCEHSANAALKSNVNSIDGAASSGELYKCDSELDEIFGHVNRREVIDSLISLRRQLEGRRLTR